MRRNTFAVAALVVACNCESTQAPAPPASPASTVDQWALRAQMSGHFEDAMALQAAVARGRLLEARDLASRLAVQTQDRSMHAAARRVVDARDVPGMARELGALGRACGACHEARNATVALAAPGVLPIGNTAEANMERHQWAAARLWEGLIAPDDDRWRAGARVLATFDIDVSRLMHEKPNEQVVELAERLRDQASLAADTVERHERARLYGDMLQTCATCHTIVRPVPVVSAQSRPSHP